MDRLTDRNKEMQTPISDHAAYGKHRKEYFIFSEESS